MVYEKRSFGMFVATGIDVWACRVLFTIVLVFLILGTVSVHRDPNRHGLISILRWSESQAADMTAVKDYGIPSKPARPAGSRLTPLEVRQLLTFHNRARADVGLAPVMWSNELARYAQEWADHLASTSRRMEHRPPSGRWKQEHGENLFMGTAGYYGVADAVIAWEKERRAYDGRAIDESNVHAFGHYTQLVWRSTRRIGCAKVACAGNVIIVCNYDPPGNILGQTPY